MQEVAANDTIVKAIIAIGPEILTTASGGNFATNALTNNILGKYSQKMSV